MGGGEPDFNIKLLSERAIKSMGVRDVNYELTFSEKKFDGQQNGGRKKRSPKSF